MTSRRILALVSMLTGIVVIWLVVGRGREKPAGRGERSGAAENATGTLTSAPPGAASRAAMVSTPAPPAKSSVTAERIRRLLGEMEPVLPGEIENATALELLRWWGEIDPAAAIAFAVDNLALHGRRVLPLELFIAWQDRRSAEARQWAERLPAGAVRRQILPALISNLAEQQPQEALRMAGELSGEQRRAALSALFLEWSASHPRTAAEAALALPDAREQNLALRHVLGKWMDRDMRAAINWAKALPPDPVPDSFDILPPVREILVEKWAAREPAAAAAYLLTTPEGAGRIGLLRTVAAQWAGGDPAEALRWAAGVASESDREVLVRGVLATVGQSDPPRAAELALALSTPGRVEHDLALVIDAWNARDAAGLTGWVNSLLERGEDPRKLPRIVSTWVATDPVVAERWLATVAPGEARDLCCEAISKYWTSRDRQRALQWAAAIADPERRRSVEATAQR